MPALDAPRSLFTDPLTGGLPATGWCVVPVGPLPAGDGIVTASSAGLTVVPSGTDDRTGEPAFQDLDVSQDLRWGAFAVPADARPARPVPWGPPLTVTATLSVSATGSWATPDPGSGGGLVVIDFVTGLVLDLILTPDRVYALYERLPRPGAGSFCHRVPLAERAPSDVHVGGVRIERGRATWFLDGRAVFAVDHLGTSIEGRPVRSDGGPTHPIEPAGVCAGLGLFTLDPSGRGIRLTARDLSITQE